MTDEPEPGRRRVTGDTVSTPGRRGARRVLRWGVPGIVTLLAALQMVPSDRTNPPVRSDVGAPDEVKVILRRACYDCHSHETRWPWYSRVAPVSWWISGHVKDARGDLNFSEWPGFDFELQGMAFRDIERQVSKGEMPPRSYKILHPEARLTPAERELIIDWARSGM